MSNIKYLAYLKTVEFQSLTKAANFLGYTQPGISHMITSLEQELGFPSLSGPKTEYILLMKGSSFYTTCGRS